MTSNEPEKSRACGCTIVQLNLSLDQTPSAGAQYVQNASLCLCLAPEQIRAQHEEEFQRRLRGEYEASPERIGNVVCSVNGDA